MTSELFRRCQDWFERYAAEFAGANGTLPPMQQLKLEHTRRVAAEARGIAAEAGWDAGAVELAAATGLLHDAGRFSQYAEFRTFEDRRSVNHAERSLAVVEAAGIPSWLAPDEAAILRDAIRLHNRPALPADTPAASRPFAELLRDADKLDIFYVFEDALANDRLSLYPEIVLHVRLEGPPSPAVLEAFFKREPVHYPAIQAVSDFLIVQLLWLEELRFRPALQRVAGRGIIDRLARHLPPFPERDAVIALCRRGLAERLSS
ncbi:MAG: HD domain-containing protein [Lentisphaeria bacterium]